ncbi:MAG: hypothetical protein QW775_02065 [Ignisphaera sp.]|uniref:Uncharacterized protein n=1 Tax=Ignisphaera aggregans TaxID=334771 RepID=A0A832FQZ8_9CREN
MISHIMIVSIVFFKVVLTLMVFGYAAFCDWIKREINPLIWVPPIIIGIALNAILTKHYLDLNIPSQNLDIIKLHTFLSLAVSIVIITISAILSFILGLLGGADVLALATFVSLYPSNLELMHKVTWGQLYVRNEIFALFFLPPIVIIFFVYLFIMLGLIVANVIHNIANKDLLRCLRLPLQKKIFYVLFGKTVKVRDISLKKFYYPIYVPNLLERATFNINEDYELWIEKLRKLDPDLVIVVTWGTPMVTFTAIGILIYALYYTIMMM